VYVSGKELGEGATEDAGQWYMFMYSG